MSDAEAERERWLDWLAEAAYGVDWRSDVDPPCTLKELAEAWQRLDQPGADNVEEMAWCIEQETGEWPRTTRQEPRR